MNQAIANNVKRLRDLHGWSQEHLAEVSGLRPRTIQRIEAGEPCRADSLMALAAAFDVELEALRTDPDAEAMKRELERWVRVPVTKVSSTADFTPLFGAHSATFDCEIRDEATREVAARLHSYITDVLMLGGDDPGHSHQYATDLLELVREIEAQRAALFVGNGRLAFASAEGKPAMTWRVAHFVVVPQDRDLKIILVPREQQVSP